MGLKGKRRWWEEREAKYHEKEREVEGEESAANETLEKGDR